MPNIFKIIESTAYAEAQAKGVFAGAAIDLADGFIHFSTAAQVRDTAGLHFFGRPDLMLFAVDSAHLGAALKWEPTRGGQLFPHCYGAIKMENVLWAKPLPWNGATHDFPAEVFA